MIVIAFCCIVINLCQSVTIFSRQSYIASAVVTSLLMLIPLVLCIRKETVFWNEAKQEPKHETRPQVDAPKENQDSNPGFWEKKKSTKTFLATMVVCAVATGTTTAGMDQVGQLSRAL